MRLNRRQLLQLALMSLPFGAGLAHYRALAASHEGEVKIKAVKAMQIRNIAGNCLIKIETDSGLVGYGEAGASGPMARAYIDRMKNFLIAQDPLRIERHFLRMISLIHPYMAHIPTVSGVDMALWDLAGKITGLPVNRLLGGPFRDAIPMYSHGRRLGDLQDKDRLKEWADEIKEAPEGFTAFKIGIASVLGIGGGARYSTTLSSEQIRRAARGYANVREAVGEEIDIAVHCHNELDTTSAIQVAHAIEPMNPLFYEDPLHVHYSDGWKALREQTKVPLLIGEKLELVKEFRPFLDNAIADIIHPDLAFAGGITGTKKIADYAMLSRRPVALHNVGSLVLTYASAHFGSAIHNFFRSESALGRPSGHVEQMSTEAPPQVRNGQLEVPEGPGLGFIPNEDYLRSQLVPGEEFW